MSAYSRPTRSASSRPKLSAPSRPRKPFISLDDENTKHFFTNKRIQNHLRRAGLLNKYGEILTQAEYDSKQTDVAIGRENRRKIDDAITEVLNDMAREHWAYARDYTEHLKNDLLYNFQRISDEYRRRIHPITIRHGSDGRIHLDTTEPRTNDQSNVTDNSTRLPTTKLPLVQPANGSTRVQSSHPLTPRGATDLDDIRQELNSIKNKLANLDKKLNTDSRRNESDVGLSKVEQALIDLKVLLNIIQGQQEILNKEVEEEKQRIDELYRQPKIHDDQTKPSQVDKQPTEHVTQISTVIKELHDRILNLEISFRSLPTGLTQEAIDQAIKIIEKKTNDRERVIEKLVPGTDDKIKQIEAQLNQLLIRFDKLPNSITYADAHQLIQNELKNLKRTNLDNNESQNLASEAINKVNHLEIQLNQFFLSTKDNIAAPTMKEPGPSLQPIQQTAPQANINFEQRFNDLERRLNNIPLPPNLGPTEQRLTHLEKQLGNINNHHTATFQDHIKDCSANLQSLQEKIAELDRRKLESQEIPKILSDIEQKSQEQLKDLYNKIMGHLQTKPDNQTVNHLIQDSEKRTNQQINALQQLIKENERALKILENYLNDLNNRINQKPTTTSKPGDHAKPERVPLTDKPTSKDLQAIMPFIELLPTFDMLTENEWI